MGHIAIIPAKFPLEGTRQWCKGPPKLPITTDGFGSTKKSDVLDFLDSLLATEQAFTLSEETPELSGSKTAGKNSASAANHELRRAYRFTWPAMGKSTVR